MKKPQEVLEALANAEPTDRAAIFQATAQHGSELVAEYLARHEYDVHKTVVVMERNGILPARESEAEAHHRSDGERDDDRPEEDEDPLRQDPGEPAASEERLAPSPGVRKVARIYGCVGMCIGAVCLFTLLAVMAARGDVAPLVAALVLPVVIPGGFALARKWWGRPEAAGRRPPTGAER